MPQSYHYPTFQDNQRTLRMSSRGLAVTVTDASLLAPMWYAFAEWVRLLENGGNDPSLAHTIRLAVYIALMVELLGLALQTRGRTHILQALERWINQHD